MFDLPTILTLLAPAVLAPLACLLLLRAIGRADEARRARPASVEAVQPAGEPARAARPAPAPATGAPVVAAAAAAAARERSVA
jgi:hypothetical protein